MKFQAVKGTRDFYPDQMRLRNWIVETWRRVSLRHGFEEYDAPIFEYLDLFTAKSGQEIAEQLFSFTDRGGRNLAIRPEITPSLARMVNAKIHSLPRPIKWFSVPRLCRAENPQKGRLREFFQWNVDVIGSDDVLADAECIFAAVDSLREMGLAPEDMQVRIGSRPLVIAKLREAGVADGQIDTALAALDKRPKVPPEAFNEIWAKAGLNDAQRKEVCAFLDADPQQTLARAAADGVDGAGDVQGLERYLRAFGAWDYCVLDWHIVRGLAYYTGIVYEIFDAGQSLRAIAGGGRYDDLLKVLGGPKVGATGFGMGDVVLGILLEEKGKIPPETQMQRVEYFVIDAADGVFDRALEVVGRLRAAGRSAEFSDKRQSIGKQLKEANRRGAKKAVLVRGDRLAVKDLESGNQADMSVHDFVEKQCKI